MLSELQNQLDKLTNQSRFIKMIIDGTLVVSKKKKDILVAELRKLNFRAFPKKEEAKKAGEPEDPIDEDAGNDDTQSGARDYDYLLGMAIWCLTQERVDKLLRQIGDVEVEIDILIGKTPKQLWNTDLDDFLHEWEYQNTEQRKRAKKSKTAGRRNSSKLGLAAAGPKRKRKDGDSDDDFAVSKKKTAPKVKQSALTNFFAAPPEKQSQLSVEPQAESGADEQFMEIDDDGDDGLPPPVVVVTKVKKAVRPPIASRTKVGSSKPAPKKTIIKQDSSDVDEAFAAVAKEAQSKPAAPARQARTAAKKKYALSDSEEDDSNGDDMLGDVSMMVRGIGAGETSTSGAARPLFSNTSARPNSSHGISRTISSVSKKPVIDVSDSDAIDETDYKSLIPQGSPVRPAPKRAGEIKAVHSDDDEEDSFDIPQPKTKMLAKKPSVTKAPLVKTKPLAKKTESIIKPVPGLSPGAKAFATKQAILAARASSKPAAKSKPVDSESDDESIANDLLSDDSPIAIRPGRRAAAATAVKKTKYAFSDEDEEDEEEEEEEESFLVDDSD
jgi:DNA topoisomerase-2